MVSCKLPCATVEAVGYEQEDGGKPFNLNSSTFVRNHICPAGSVKGPAHPPDQFIGKYPSSGREPETAPVGEDKTV